MGRTPIVRMLEGYRVKHSGLIDTRFNEIINEIQNNIPKNPKKPDIEIYDDVFRSIKEK